MEMVGSGKVQFERIRFWAGSVRAGWFLRRLFFCGGWFFVRMDFCRDGFVRMDFLIKIGSLGNWTFLALLFKAGFIFFTGLNNPFFDCHGGIALVDLVCIKIFSCHTLNRQDRMCFAGYSRTYYRFSADPNPVFEMDWQHHQIKLLRSVVMITGEQHSALRNTDTFADNDVGKIINPYLFADPAIVADKKFPWVFDIDARLNHYSPAYFCAEHAKDHLLEARR